MNIKLPFEISEDKQKEIDNLEYISIGQGTNYAGQTFNHLTLLGRASSDSPSIPKWWAICDCPEHTIKSYAVADIKRGRVKSCGCYVKQTSSENGKKNRKDYTDEICGDFIAVEPTQHYSGGNIKWLFQCLNCGYEKEAAIGDMRKGYGASCPVCGDKVKSLGEKKLCQILTEQNIKFIQQKTFDSCVFVTSGRKGFFDFYLPDLNILIEYDGIQHFIDRKGRKDRLEEIQERDSYKTNWCKENNIPLIRIPYLDFNLLDWEYLQRRIKEVTQNNE